MDLDSTQKPFIWRKKYEEQGIKIDEKQIALENKRRAEANRIELEKIKERRRLRELEYQQKLSDGEFMQRQKEAEQHQHYIQQDKDFDLRQQRYRSKIRISNGRAERIDLFTYYIDVFGVKPDNKGSGYLQEEKIDLSESPVELLNPCDWFNGLQLADLEALAPKIKTYMNSDCEENQQYWKDLLDITRNESDKLQAVKDRASGKASERDIIPAVIPDVEGLFRGRSIIELNEMEDDIRKQMDLDDPSIDRNFYKCVLSRLRAHRARVRLSRNHKKNLERQKGKILETKAEDKTSANKQPANGDNIDIKIEADLESMEIADEIDHDDDAIEDRFKEARRACIDEYKKGGYSPRMYRKSELSQGIVCTDYQKEFDVLCHNRYLISSASSLDEVRKATMSQEEREFMEAATKGLDNNSEATFACEQPIRGSDNRAKTYIWADKYQPRKPRYFNRVHTGFEWNKYNQTHYDIDNPPPKVVQGYKFNIFYPDLIDKSKTPRFVITPCKDDKEFCIIKFTAGPPYEDIAFRIVNREWNSSHKTGYKCQFSNNMLQLWFQFKRYKYRR